MNSVITYFQIFGIGFSFGIGGPCFLVCTPILITYIIGRQGRWPKTIIDIVIFLSGRLFAYIILGALAGLSGLFLRRFIESNLISFFTPLSGVISIILGILVLIYRDPAVCGPRSSRNKVYDFGSLLALGFTIGISPCAPLIALLFEIALISKSVLEGASYAFAFGLGTFLSGLLVVGALTGLLKGFAQKVIHSREASITFRVICAMLLILLGVGLILGRRSS